MALSSQDIIYTAVQPMRNRCIPVLVVVVSTSRLDTLQRFRPPTGGACVRPCNLSNTRDHVLDRTNQHTPSFSTSDNARLTARPLTRCNPTLQGHRCAPVVQVYKLPSIGALHDMVETSAHGSLTTARPHWTCGTFEAITFEATMSGLARGHN